MSCRPGHRPPLRLYETDAVLSRSHPTAPDYEADYLCLVPRRPPLHRHDVLAKPAHLWRAPFPDPPLDTHLKPQIGSGLASVVRILCRGTSITQKGGKTREKREDDLACPRVGPDTTMQASSRSRGAPRGRFSEFWGRPCHRFVVNLAKTSRIPATSWLAANKLRYPSLAKLPLGYQSGAVWRTGPCIRAWVSGVIRISSPQPARLTCSTSALPPCMGLVFQHRICLIYEANNSLCSPRRRFSVFLDVIVAALL